ncbi:MAG: GNAT family N-acetyltransferase [Candidatus Omnitrophica bacterium]|nr:GNAT family N-acetyltransferase [Candidatus Omnitrophota bacterium]
MLTTDIKSIQLYIETDPDACRHLWEEAIPQDVITDLWEVRACFARHYQRPLAFLAAKEGQRLVGLVPLCYIEEHDYYAVFPGEVWHGKTWLEQNRIFAKNPQILQVLLDRLKQDQMKVHLRYLRPQPDLFQDHAAVDETGYVFHPKTVDYHLDDYFKMFSRRSIKSIRRDIDQFYARSMVVRKDHWPDFDDMVRLNIEQFGEDSYFTDERFRAAFRGLGLLLKEKGSLILTTLLIQDEIAAVDFGCLYNNVYTLLAGGTNKNFPGISKPINMHHLEQACRERYDEVDFLCGDFNWKKIFHLTPRPLMVITNMENIA